MRGAVLSSARALALDVVRCYSRVLILAVASHVFVVREGGSKGGRGAVYGQVRACTPNGVTSRQRNLTTPPYSH